MNDLSQPKKYCFYTVSDYICCHMYLHNTIFVQYTIVQHHCQTCEIKYGKLLLFLRSDTPKEKHKSEITETSWERGKEFPEIYWETNASQFWNEISRAFQKQMNVLDLKSVYQLSECLLSSFAPLKMFLIWEGEKMSFCSHLSSGRLHSLTASFLNNKSGIDRIILWAMLSEEYKITLKLQRYQCVYRRRKGLFRVVLVEFCLVRNISDFFHSA